MKTNRWMPVLLATAFLVLPGCGAKKEASPEPAELYAAIEKQADLPDELTDLTQELLEDFTGISPEEYESAVYYLAEAGLAPDEIAIVKAKDTDSADHIQILLQKRLDDKQKAAENYLTEFMPILKAGVVRRDGLTVSLLVTANMENVLSACSSLVD